jgi:hypothetical protein
MRKPMLVVPFLVAAAGVAADNPVDRWAGAAGGREKLGAVKAIYREGTLQFGGFEGSIKVWHTSDGRYRKEEQVGPFSNIETFDGKNAFVQRGGAAKKVEGADLAVALSKAYANSNAMFFVFSPNRRGTLTTEGADTVVFKPEGGIEWRVTLDPQTSLPKTMVHKEGDRTISVTLGDYETVDGIRLEKEIHRSNGDSAPGAVIRFNKTVINPPIDPSMFTLDAR